jgi:hypothetical protein
LSGPPHQQVRCERCRDVVGVYEPVIALVEGEALRTSLAIMPERLRGAPCFHESCFESGLEASEADAV